MELKRLRKSGGLTLNRLRKSSGLTSKMDNTFVYNIVAKCIVLFNFLFYSHFNFHFYSPFYSPFNFHFYSPFYSQLLN